VSVAPLRLWGKHPICCPSTPGLRWARQPRNRQGRAIRGFDWELRLAAITRPRPPGARALGLGPAPGSFNRPAGRHDIASERIMIWSLRPQGTSAKNWSPDPLGAAVRQLEWIAQGFTAMSFWVAPNRMNSGLESWLRCQGHGPSALASSIEPE
jgi:hypothetical protein